MNRARRLVVVDHSANGISFHANIELVSISKLKYAHTPSLQD